MCVSLALSPAIHGCRSLKVFTGTVHPVVSLVWYGLVWKFHTMEIVQTRTATWPWCMGMFCAGLQCLCDGRACFPPTLCFNVWFHWSVTGLVWREYIFKSKVISTSCMYPIQSNLHRSAHHHPCTTFFFGFTPPYHLFFFVWFHSLSYFFFLNWMQYMFNTKNHQPKQ